MNLPPTELLTTEFLLGTCFLYKILAPQGVGKEDIAPQVNVPIYVAVLYFTHFPVQSLMEAENK